MSKETTIEAQVNARYTLVQSAKMARRGGISGKTWMEHPEIQKAASDFDLHPDILYHIAAFVWTFRR